MVTGADSSAVRLHLGSGSALARVPLTIAGELVAAGGSQQVIALDTNVLVRFLVEDDARQSEESALCERASR